MELVSLGQSPIKEFASSLHKIKLGKGNSLVLVDSPLGVYRSLIKTQERVGEALQLWPAIHLGKGYSKIKSVCLDMPSPDMQRLFW